MCDDRGRENLFNCPNSGSLSKVKVRRGRAGGRKECKQLQLRHSSANPNRDGTSLVSTGTSFVNILLLCSSSVVSTRSPAAGRQHHDPGAAARHVVFLCKHDPAPVLLATCVYLHLCAEGEINSPLRVHSLQLTLQIHPRANICRVTGPKHVFHTVFYSPVSLQTASQCVFPWLGGIHLH